MHRKLIGDLGREEANLGRFNRYVALVIVCPANILYFGAAQLEVPSLDVRG